MESGYGDTEAAPGGSSGSELAEENYQHPEVVAAYMQVQKERETWKTSREQLNKMKRERRFRSFDNQRRRRSCAALATWWMLATPISGRPSASWRCSPSNERWRDSIADNASQHAAELSTSQRCAAWSIRVPCAGGSSD